MASRDDQTLPATRRTRKSIGGQSPIRKRAEKENATVDIGATLAENRKKSRSKSIGPGGLDVLKPGAGNRRVSLAAPSRPPPRSILKQSVQSLPEIPPHKPKAPNGAAYKTDQSTSSTSTEGSSASGTKIALRTEEEQQKAAREREERERAAAEKEASDRREARRKSLANRRVSFAAEATLHTFHEIEYMQDSTTSTDSTRRASSVVGQSPAPRVQPQHPESDASEPPSTPPEAVEDPIPDSPADQRELHQKKRRRSSGIPPLNFNNPQDETLSSTIYSSDSEQADGVAEIQGEELSDSDSEVEDGTMMTVDADEMTSASVASARTEASDSTSLDENLRLAAQRASTQRLDEEDDEEEEIPAFAGWIKKPTVETQHSPKNTTELPDVPQHTSDQDDENDTQMDVDMDMEMEMTSAVGGILKPNNQYPQEDEGEDMSMDVTRVFGGIISQVKPATRRQSIKPSPPKISEGDGDVLEMPMDLTMALGGIKPSRVSEGSQIDIDEYEDMSMELTTAIGTVIPLPSNGKAPAHTRRRSMAVRTTAHNNDRAMAITEAVGRILSSAPTKQDDDADETIGMDMTTAIGGIIKPLSKSEGRIAARKAMEDEADQPDLPVMAAPTAKTPPKQPVTTIADEAGSPSMAAFRGQGLRRTPSRRTSTTPKDSKAEVNATPKPVTPSKKASATPTVETPLRTPPPQMLGSRSTSPKRHKSPAATTPRSTSKKRPSLFHQDPETGAATPRVILSPKKRRMSGVGIDRPGLGSPRISELLDRRESIGDAAQSFLPLQPDWARKGVSFADPRVMGEEVDKERREEEERENGRKILEREADGDTTANLREMIQNMSPKKAPMRGRKSLHVGSARGVLGKRPMELDDDEDEEQDGVKRLKGLQGSPVKNVKLQSPPSKAETTGGRRTRASAKAGVDNWTPSLSQSPIKASSPQHQGRFRSVDDDQPSTTFNFDHTQTVNERAVDADGDDDRIHLQDFLNMTTIRFMELTTTKRRHTVAPTAPRENGVSDKDDISLEKCVAAGACTVPMLELYQHSCRELKKYIAGGKRIVREIESAAFEENPPLFREYITASPEFKVIMDGQFKNVKTHARLMSKAMWYEWRMKLQDGLKEGLIRIAEGMTTDDDLLREQEELLACVMPELIEKYEILEREHMELEAVARELADCDPADLDAARAELVDMDREIDEKTNKLAMLRLDLGDSEANITSMTARKQQCLDDIKEADTIREECRGWSSTEIATLKGQVDKIEREHGWAITKNVGSQVTMTYRREIELVLDISSFQPGQENSPIGLSYIAGVDGKQHRAIPTAVERDFWLQCICDQVRALPQSQTKLSRMLGLVSAAWDMAGVVADHVSLLNVMFPTTVTKTSDSSIAVRSSLLLVPLTTKVDIEFHLHHSLAVGGDVEVTVVPQAKVVYGESFGAQKMTDFLATRIGPHIKSLDDQQSSKLWVDVVAELKGLLNVRGRKNA